MKDSPKDSASSPPRSVPAAQTATGAPSPIGKTIARASRTRLDVLACRRLDLPDPTRLLEKRDYPSAQIDLPPPEPENRRARKGMVIVMPGFSERGEGQQDVVSTPIMGLERHRPEPMRQGIDAGGGMIREKRADETSPQEARTKSGPAPRHKPTQEGGE